VNLEIYNVVQFYFVSIWLGTIIYKQLYYFWEKLAIWL